jgi:hypothetical protein
VIRRKVTASFGALALLLATCDRAPRVGGDVVATVGKEPIPFARFEGFLHRQVGEGAGGLDSQVLSLLFDQFLDEELLMRLAVADGHAPAGASRRRAVDALLEGIADQSISPDEVAEHYRRHQDDYRLPERVVLYHILVGEEEGAVAARERILAGAAFAEVAEEISKDPSAVHGGFQGEVALADLPLAFAEPLARMAPGEVSPIVRAADGFHLFKVEERLPEEELPLEMVAEEIEQLLRRRQADARLASLVRQARTQYNVEVYEQNLPFHYQGEHPSRG